jgi:predicted RNA-binding Zn-ribbon protein involved in translation (DUF1610 family)
VSVMNLPGGAIHKDLRDLVYEAIKEFGWTAKQSRKGTWTIYSPERDEKFTIPTSSGDSGYLHQQLKSRIVRAVKAQADRAKAGMEAGGASSTIANVSLNDVGAICEDCGEEYVTWEAFAVHQYNEHPAPASPEPLQAPAQEAGGVTVEDVVLDAPTGDVVTPEDETSGSPVSAGSTTMSGMEEDMQETLRPWRAVKQRHSNGDVTTYESSAVLEVVVDGEVTKYQCPVCADPVWRSDRPRSVVSHHAQHVAKGEAEPVSSIKDERTESGDKYLQTVKHRPWIVPKEEEHKALYDAMLANPRTAKETTSIYSQRLARVLADQGWVLRKVGESDPEMVNESDLLIEEIRALIGGDTSESEALKARIVGLEEDLKEAQEEGERYSGFVKAIASLAKDEVK